MKQKKEKSAQKYLCMYKRVMQGCLAKAGHSFRLRKIVPVNEKVSGGNINQCVYIR